MTTIKEERYSAADTFLVENQDSAPVDVFVSKFSNADGQDAWFTLQAAGSDKWQRRDWEFVVFRRGDQRSGVYRKPGLKLVFTGFKSDYEHREAKISEAPHDQTNRFLIQNQTTFPIDVFVTKYSGGSDAWYTILPGESDSWGRSFWDGVVVRVGTQRWGVYRAPSKKLTFSLQPSPGADTPAPVQPVDAPRPVQPVDAPRPVQPVEAPRPVQPF